MGYSPLSAIPFFRPPTRWIFKGDHKHEMVNPSRHNFDRSF